MKKLSIASFIAIMLLLMAACTKEKSEQEPAAKAKLLGTWKLSRYIDETWTPDNVLIYQEEEVGEPGDSVIFKSDNMLYGYEDRPNGIEEDVYPYTFLNDSTLSWDEEAYVIRKLTDTELYLYQEEMNTERNEKDIIKMFLVR